jgi:cytochrome c553
MGVLLAGIGSIGHAEKPAPGTLKAAEEKAVNLCSTCHGPDAEGKEDTPRLAGQHAKYVAKQLRSMQDESRANEQMRAIVKKLRPEEMLAVSAYVQSR